MRVKLSTRNRTQQTRISSNNYNNNIHMLRSDKRGTREMGILNNESVRNSLPLPFTTKVNTYIIVAREHSP